MAERWQIQGHIWTLETAVPYPARSRHAEWTQALSPLLAQGLQAAGVAGARVVLHWQTRIAAHAVRPGNPLLPGVKNIIAVASGKGGVGKSTTAVNLALALAQEGAHVGILDADIYGPSQPMMLGVNERPHSDDGKTMQPLVGHGVQMISMGLLIDADSPMIWRGPMATQALDQLLRQTQWKDLDYLIVDMPPGTGDIALTLSQRVPLTGAVIVTTPQDIALLDARKGLRMFEKVNVPVLGVVENMAVYCCPNCGHAEAIFGEGGGQTMAQDFGVPLLAQLPLAAHIRAQTDAGQPTVVSQPDSPAARLYLQLAQRVGRAIASQGKDYSHKFPSIRVSSDT
ncbi:iron-sulfur cluster carrier protein ApbC [Comamonadaceae bacterium SL12-8]|uniref:Iron-sulfur cluster carrier protein ApbC n=1 Tax=Amphibiibacter pelophylacis TaxID=1799477 RepID=A0ACC6P1K6_9BURK